MNRRLIAACAALAGTALPAGNEVLGQQSPTQADEAVRLALNRTVPEVSYDKTPFREVIGDFSKRLGVDFRVRWEKLKLHGITGDAPITLKLKGLPAKRVLPLVLKEAGVWGLSYDVRDGAVLISTWPDLRPPPVTQTYMVRDLVGTRRGRLVDEEGDKRVRARESRLLDLVRSMIDPDSWQANGGEMGTAHIRNATLTIRSRADNHEQIRMLLQILRAAPGSSTWIPPRAKEYARANEAVHAALQRVLPQVRFDRVPFRKVIDEFRRRLDINIYVGWAGLGAFGVDAERPVRIELRNLPVEQALHLVLQEVDVDFAPGFEVRQGVLEIATEDRIQNRFALRVYPVVDLLNKQTTRVIVAPARGEDSHERALQLCQLITDTVEPDSWVVNGGVGDCQIWEGRLLVRNYGKVHRLVEAYLNALRNVPKGGSAWVPPPSARELQSNAKVRAALGRLLPKVAFAETPFEDTINDLHKRLGINIHVFWLNLEDVGIQRDTSLRLNLRNVVAEAALHLILEQLAKNVRLDYDVRGGVVVIASEERVAQRTRLRIHDASDLLKEDTAVWTANVEHDEERARPSMRLVDIIQNVAEPDSWLLNGGIGTCQAWEGRLCIRSFPRAHRQIEALLHSLRTVPKGGSAWASLKSRQAAEADEHVRRALRKALPSVRFVETAFDECIQYFEDLLEINIRVQWKHLTDLGVDAEAPVSMSAKQETTAAILHRFLRSINPALTYRVADGALVISTVGGLGGALPVRVYDVSDLAKTTELQAELGGLIVNTIEPDSWVERGGEAVIRHFGKRLVIAQHEDGHRRIEELLAQMRKALKGGG